MPTGDSFDEYEENNNKTIDRGPSRAKSDRINVYPNDVDCFDNCVNAGTDIKWIPLTGDEYNDFKDVIAPIGGVVDDYIKQTYDASYGTYSPYEKVWDNEAGGASLIKSVYEPDEPIDSEKGTDTIPSSYMQSYINAFYGVTAEEKEVTGNFFRAIWSDIQHAVKDNKFFSPENIERNFSRSERQFFEQLNDYIDKKKETGVPDIQSINRIYAFKRSILSLLDSMEVVPERNESLNPDRAKAIKFSNLKKTYIKAQKDMYDYYQKYEILGKKLVDLQNKKVEDKLVHNKEVAEQIQDFNTVREEYQTKFQNALETSKNYYAAVKEDICSNINREQVQFGNGAFKWYTIFPVGNSDEYKKLNTAIGNMKTFTDNLDHSTYTKESKEQFDALKKDLKDKIFEYLKKNISKSTDYRAWIEAWAKGDYEKYPLTKDTIKDVKNSKWMPFGKRRVEAALNLLYELNENKNFGTVLDDIKGNLDEMKKVDKSVKGNTEIRKELDNSIEKINANEKSIDENVIEQDPNIINTNSNSNKINENEIDIPVMS